MKNDNMRGERMKIATNPGRSRSGLPGTEAIQQSFSYTNFQFVFGL